MCKTATDQGARPQPLKANAALAAAKTAVESSKSAMVVTDPRRPDNPIVVVNDAFCRLTGYARSEVLGRNCRFLQGPETHPQAVGALQEAITTGRPGIATLMNYGKDGRAFLNCVQVLPVRDDAGDIMFFVGSQCEVTPLETIFPVSAQWTFGA